MDDDQTWIEPRKQGSRPEQNDDFDSLPPMPPAPGPPGSGGRNRGLLLRIVIIGLVFLVLCAVGGFALWQIARTGLVPVGFIATVTPDSETIAQTAAVEETRLASIPTETPSPEPTLAPTDTLLPPTETAAPTELPTETPVPTSAAPTFTTTQAMFCRQGPSATYDVGRALNAGETYPIVGRSTSPVDGFSNWWQIDLGDRLCFVSEPLGTTRGDPSGVPVVQPPPTPTPTPTPTPSSTPTATATP